MQATRLKLHSPILSRRLQQAKVYLFRRKLIRDPNLKSTIRDCQFFRFDFVLIQILNFKSFDQYLRFGANLDYRLDHRLDRNREQMLQ